MIERNAPDVLIIGAGPAGSCAAALLHRAGVSCAIVEKQHFPRFVIGESLLPRCMDLLENAGLLEAVRQRNYQHKPGALFLRGDERSGFDFSEQFTTGWDHTWQVPREDFDQTLASAVADMGVPVHFGVSLMNYTPAQDDKPGVAVLQDEDGNEWTWKPRFCIDASGWGRVLPRLLQLEKPVDFPVRKAVFSRVQGDRRPNDDGRIWVCCHPDGPWIWLIPFPNGECSVGVVAAPEWFESLSASEAEGMLSKAIAGDANAHARVGDLAFTAPVRSLQGYAASVSSLHGPGWCLTGNAGEFLDPVFSSGVTLALESATLAAETVLKELNDAKPNWDEAFEQPVRKATNVFKTYVSGWYDGRFPTVIFNENPDENIKKMICSVLAGYVRDERNPFVAQHKRKLTQLAKLLNGELPVLQAGSEA